MSISTIFNILVSFYQLKALIAVQTNKTEKNKTETKFIDKILNMEIVVRSSKSLEVLCPFHGFDAVMREVLNGYVIPLLMLVTITFLLLIIKFIKRYKPTKARWLLSRLYIGYYIILAFCYKNICQSTWNLLNCKTIGDIKFLYIAGNVECFTLWQIPIFIFLICWVLPFPFAISLGYHLFKNKKISIWKLLLFSMFPMLCILKTCVSRWKGTLSNRNKFVDERLKEILEQPYRKKLFWWESWRLVERLIVSGFAAFFTNPIYRILSLTPVFVLLTYFHFRMNPYKCSMYILKRLDSVSWFCLSLHLFINGIRAVVYIYDVPNVDFISNALQAANILENIFSPLWYLIISFIFKKVYEKFLRR